MENDRRPNTGKRYIKWTLFIFIMTLFIKPAFSEISFEVAIGDCGEVSIFLSGTNDWMYSGSIEVVDFRLYFGDGTSEDFHFEHNSNIGNIEVTHHYTLNGEFEIRLCPRDYPCKTTFIGTSVTIDNAINAVFTVSQVCTGTPTTFINGTTGADTYSWTFGDDEETTSEEENPAPFDYGVPGSYSVSLFVENSETGCFDNYVQIAAVEMSPSLTISASETEVCVGSVVQFTPTTVLGGQYSWEIVDVDDGEYNFSTTQVSPAHYFVSPGEYRISYDVENHCGVYHSGEIYITVNEMPDISILADNSACENTLVQFNADNLNYDSYAWDFGDGTTGVDARVEHKFYPSGFYNVTLSVQSHGCVATVTHGISIAAFPQVEILTPDGNDICPDEHAILQAHIINYTGGEDYVYDWQWTGGSSDLAQLDISTNNQSLLEDNYTLVVSNTCGYSNTVTETINIYPFPDASLEILSIASCPEVNDASVLLTISTGNPEDYTITWPSYSTATGIQADDIYTGNLYVTLTDNIGGCSKVVFANIGHNNMNINVLNVKNVNCSSGSDGEIDIEIVGGTSSYDYNWSNDATTQDVSNLSAGIYSVTVTDANNCSAIKNVVISEPVLTLSVTPDAVTCGDGATAEVTATAGMYPAPSVVGYTFDWYFSTGSQVTAYTPTTTGNQSTISLPVEEYYVILTDNNSGCTFQGENFNVAQGPVVSLTLSSSLGNFCNGIYDAWAKAVPQSPYPPYTYLWDDGTNTIGSTNMIQNLSVGTYSVTVTDSRGCEAIDNITITQPSAMSVAIDIITCGLQAEVTNGTSDYDCKWIRVVRDGNNNIISENTEAISSGSSPITQTDLPAGEYYAEVIDANGCHAISGYQYHNPPELSSRQFVLSSRWVKPTFTEPDPEPDPILEDQKETIIAAIYDAVEECRASTEELALNGYCGMCQSRDNVRDKMGVKYSQNYSNYTLYYYDRSGNLVQTVPPRGVDTYGDITPEIRNRKAPSPLNHQMKTTYKYNSLNQLVEQTTPDGGTTKFIYNEKGQLRFSQNAHQLAEGKYSYTKYDNQERIIESGESTQEEANLFTLTGDYSEDVFPSGIEFPEDEASNKYIVKTVYSESGDVDYFGQEQEYLQNRVSYTYTDNDGDFSTCNDQVYTYYSYDPHGNVEWLVQDLPGFTKNYIGYEYDLVSNNVLKVKYNEQRPDRFYHRYEYDSDNRIKEIYTSADGRIWDKDATYEYYKHGPLKKTGLGEDKVQNLDYTYTINGWLKAINHPALDITQDPSQDGQNSLTGFAKDVFGMTLGYYNGDFRDDSQFGNTSNTNVYSTSSLYNGNISSWTTQNSSSDIENAGLMTGRIFEYDQLNRITKSNQLYNDGVNWDQQGANNYETEYTYDKNGNIETLKRKSDDASGNQMDDLSYLYETGTNKLKSVTDVSTDHANSANNDIYGNLTIANTGDPEDAGKSVTYEYDEIGNIKRVKELLKIEGEDYFLDREIKWTPSGKVAKVTTTRKNLVSSETATEYINFTYDASGNRVIKSVDHVDGQNKREYYLRDAQGNIMSVYERIIEPTGNPEVVNVTFKVKEIPVYGSDRIGMLVPKDDDQYILYYFPGVLASEIENISFDVNGIKINNSLYNWIVPRNAAIEDANGNPICDCQLDRWEFAQNGIVGTVRKFMGKTGNNIGVVENNNGDPLLYTVTANNYLGTPNVSLVLDKNGNVVKGSQKIKASPEAKTLVMKNPGKVKEYSLISVDENNRAWIHKIDLTAQGFSSDVSNPSGEVSDAIALSSPSEKIGHHLALIEDEINKNNYLYTLRYNEPTMQGQYGQTEILAYTFTDDGQIPTPEVIAIVEGFDKTGEGELQLSSDGKHLLYYNKLMSIGGFNYKDVDLVSLELSESHTSVVPGSIKHINTIGGSHGKSSADFTANTTDYIFNQHSTIELNGTDKQTWYMDNIPDGTPEQTSLNEIGDIRRGKDLRVYLPGHDNGTYINALSIDETMVTQYSQEQIDDVNYLLAGSLPGQIIRISGSEEGDLLSRRVGLKKYEIKDHLGNVRAVVSDVKTPVESSPGIIDHSEAQLLSVADYYPFGMEMPGREAHSKTYRFGFNGKEKNMDDEWSGATGTIYDYGFRIYDARIARFLSVDPLFESYPWYTPYQFAGNKPIWAVDLDGLEENKVNDGVLIVGLMTVLENLKGLKVQLNNPNSKEVTIELLTKIDKHQQVASKLIYTLYLRLKESKGNEELQTAIGEGLDALNDYMVSSLNATIFIVTIGEGAIAANSIKELFKFGAEEIIEYAVSEITGIPVINPKDIADGMGVVYRRYNKLTKKYYIGQAKNLKRYEKRMLEHGNANPDAEFEFEIIGTGKEGPDLNLLEEDMIRKHGVPSTKKSVENGSGTLENGRYQMSEPNYRDSGGKVDKQDGSY